MFPTPNPYPFDVRDIPQGERGAPQGIINKHHQCEVFGQFFSGATPTLLQPPGRIEMHAAVSMELLRGDFAVNRVLLGERLNLRFRQRQPRNSDFYSDFHSDFYLNFENHRLRLIKLFSISSLF